ncbi:SMP-30/gluconolactonase/LRE family protein [Serratia marcescens]|jgi:sugar lactone lactonase YvrE|uniref:SMP-30/gluconolactonase/LRE family protein n=1 Tax=Serratia TaxID=613 RepID=UPI0002F43BEE|nr:MULTISPECIES: SMP-30/gluconolactonase/LRE family protein [Serratia]EMD6650615.1 SMP-30/gluconolactonase/LRE family protein [Serratia marcescens]MBD8464321.1 SMP-30/gluconolactonase/LRE family protein [Serratia marcescens]MBK5574734.1 SMP-30/gluconolactonase/LRE family protein [Serratia marcescens]MBN5265567.1 SMP-30/gluconolactonase/LRE family protein [Serratia marcescens]MBN5404248.1 SMP-30/gluconolactonase/LRE family protein [Serratia marcescens]
MSKRILNQKNFLGITTLNWLRTDLARETCFAHWGGPHADLVSRNEFIRDYNQYHFNDDIAGLWPLTPEVVTDIPADKRIDGVSEIILDSIIRFPLSIRSIDRIFKDKKNVFCRKTLNMTTLGGGKVVKTGDYKNIHARCVVLIRRREKGSLGDFKRFIHDSLAHQLGLNNHVIEVRSQVFAPWFKAQWNAPDAAHGMPPEYKYHASIVIGANDNAGLLSALAQVASLNSEIAYYCSVIHAYSVANTLINRVDGRTTIPQLKPSAKPRLEPVRRVLPHPPERTYQPTGTTPFKVLELLKSAVKRPEDVISDMAGNIYYGGQGGKIYRYSLETENETIIADTTGRPLGLEWLKCGSLLVCDAHRGLLKVRLDGHVETLVERVHGLPLRFCSNATASADGTIWFTQSTNRYDFEHYEGAMIEHRGSGQLLRRDTDGQVHVLLDGLHFPNGITLDSSEMSVIFAETDAYRLRRLWVQGPKAGHLEIFADNLPGFPDNISRMQKGYFWVAMGAPRNKSLDRMGTMPGFLRKLIWRLPKFMMPKPTRTVWAMAFNEDGGIFADMQGNADNFFTATAVVETNGRLYMASVEADGIATLEITFMPKR